MTLASKILVAVLLYAIFFSIFVTFHQGVILKKYDLISTEEN